MQNKGKESTDDMHSFPQWHSHTGFILLCCIIPKWCQGHRHAPKVQKCCLPPMEVSRPSGGVARSKMTFNSDVGARFDYCCPFPTPSVSVQLSVRKCNRGKFQPKLACELFRGTSAFKPFACHFNHCPVSFRMPFCICLWLE